MAQIVEHGRNKGWETKPNTHTFIMESRGQNLRACAPNLMGTCL